MKPSQTLKTLLWVNELRESLAKEDFQRGQRALKELEEMLQEITRRPEKLYQRLEGRVLSGQELHLFAQQISSTLQEKEKVEQILQTKRQELEKLRQKAVKAYQQRRMAEILHERAQEAYQKELEENERKELDDMVLLRRGKDGL